jgi:hypothetical protein
MDYKATRTSLLQGLEQIKSEIRRHEDILGTLRVRMHQNEGALIFLDTLESQAQAEKPAPAPKEEKHVEETDAFDLGPINPGCRCVPDDKTCAKSDPAGCHVAAIQGNDKSATESCGKTVRPFSPE